MELLSRQEESERAAEPRGNTGTRRDKDTGKELQSRRTSSPAARNMASLYNQLVEDMEKVASAVEQGYDYMVGSAKQQRGDDMPSPMTDEQDMLFEEDGEDFMEDEFGSPLMGMADNVMSDIMSTQVRSLSRILGSPFTVQYELTDRTFANIHAPRSVLKRRRSTYRRSRPRLLGRNRS